VTGKQFTALLTTIFLIFLIWGIDFRELRRMVALGMELELGIARAEEVLKELAILTAKAQDLDDELKKATKDLEALRDYGDVAKLNVFGVSGKAGRGLSETSRISRTLEGVGREVPGGKLRPRCDSESMDKIDRAIHRSPTFPFSYYAKAFCLRQKDDRAWRTTAQEALLYSTSSMFAVPRGSFLFLVVASSTPAPAAHNISPQAKRFPTTPGTSYNRTTVSKPHSISPSGSSRRTKSHASRTNARTGKARAGLPSWMMAVAFRKSASEFPYVLLLLLVFAVSRVLLFALGMRFDATPLDWFWQFVDPELLRHQLLQSVYYLHSQPPLFNLFLGLILKLCPGEGCRVVAFSLIYQLFGLLAFLSMFLLMRRLNIPRNLSVLLSILFMVSPSSILYENWLFYTYPLMSLLCLSAFFLHRFISGSRLRDALLFFALLASICLTRSLFHILWFLSFGLVLIFGHRPAWKKGVVALSLPLLVMFLWYAKNAYYFGSFTSSSWSGMHLARVTTRWIPHEDRQALIQNRTLSEFAAIPPFRKYEDYEPYLPVAAQTNVPVLDLEWKSTGHKNLHHQAYVEISKRYMDDALVTLRLHPAVYLRNVMRAVVVYSRPGSDYIFFDSNGRRDLIGTYERFYSLVFFGQLSGKSLIFVERFDAEWSAIIWSSGLFVLAGLPLLILSGLRAGIREMRNEVPDRAFAITVLFLVLNVLYVTALGTALELGENFRFRVLIEPFSWMLLGLLLARGQHLRRGG
jgi:hypothetical protein